MICHAAGKLCTRIYSARQRASAHQHSENRTAIALVTLFVQYISIDMIEHWTYWKKNGTSSRSRINVFRYMWLLSLLYKMETYKPHLKRVEQTIFFIDAGYEVSTCVLLDPFPCPLNARRIWLLLLFICIFFEYTWALTDMWVETKKNAGWRVRMNKNEEKGSRTSTIQFYSWLSRFASIITIDHVACCLDSNHKIQFS